MKTLFGTPSLFSRLVKVLLLLTITTVTLFTCATLFITYAFEDVIFNERLKQAHVKLLNGEPLPFDLKLVDNEQGVEPGTLQKIRFLEIGGAKDEGEFSLGERHYHYLKTEFGTIVYDTTDVTIVSRALEDIFLILSILFLPILLLTFWVARYSARYALKPFDQLCEIFLQSEKNALASVNHVETIKEVDVKELAIKLHGALTKKEEVLARQLQLNQGIAHELRTPLQVMAHSIELLNFRHQYLADSAPYARLKKSMRRMTRRCNALLWLTSQRVCQSKLDAGYCIQQLVTELSGIADAHKLQIEVDIIEELQLMIPEEVLELIFFNLLNNAIQHGSKIDNGLCWNVQVDHKQIVFSNSASSPENGKIHESNFGVGLMIVKQLAERFSLQVRYKLEEAVFFVIMSTK